MGESWVRLAEGRPLWISKVYAKAQRKNRRQPGKGKEWSRLKELLQGKRNAIVLELSEKGEEWKWMQSEK